MAILRIHCDAHLRMLSNSIISSSPENARLLRSIYMSFVVKPTDLEFSPRLGRGILSKLTLFYFDKLLNAINVVLFAVNACRFPYIYFKSLFIISINWMLIYLTLNSKKIPCCT